MKRINKIGLYIDGGYFSYVSKYYKDHPEYNARLNINNLPGFIEDLANETWGDECYNKITRAGMFRYRNSATTLAKENKLMATNAFDDVIRHSGLENYLVMNNHGSVDYQTELMVKAMSDVISKRVDTVILITASSRYATFVKELTANGINVLLPFWEFDFNGNNGEAQTTYVSSHLMNYATDAIDMVAYIETLGDSSKQLLFVSESEWDDSTGEAPEEREIQYGYITHINYHKKFGFIEIEETGDSVYFSAGDVMTNGSIDFESLQNDDYVSFYMGMNHQGKCAVEINLEGDVIPA